MKAPDGQDTGGGWHANGLVGSLCDVSERDVRRVLVIDDDDLSREVLALLLEDAGYEVSSASSGEEALTALETHETNPDAVLMDWQMPGVSGDELARRLRARCRESMVLLAMSGSKVPEPRLATDGFLLKPFSMEEFEAAVHGRLSRAWEPTSSATDSRGAKEEMGGGETAVAASDDDVLDAGIFHGFETMVGKGPLQELYRQCVRDAERHVTAMQSAWASGDDAGLRKNAHAIKGSLGMVGARELQGMCAVLEGSGIADNHLATLAEFPDALERLRRMLIARGVEI